MKTWKKIGGIALDIVIVLVFLVSAVLIVANVTTEEGEMPNVFGYVVNSVQSESMSGTFEKGSIVIAKVPDENTEIAVGDIITFYQQQGDVLFANTHRIVDTKVENGRTYYQTQGDNRTICPEPDREWKSASDIKAVYVTNVPVIGSVIDFIKKPVGFVICLVLPLLAFIAYQIYKLVTIYMQAKKEEILEEAKQGVSDDAKDAIIKEYLAKLQAEEAAKQAEQDKKSE